MDFFDKAVFIDKAVVVTEFEIFTRKLLDRRPMAVKILCNWHITYRGLANSQIGLLSSFQNSNSC